jgi:hypothetical protein
MRTPARAGGVDIIVSRTRFAAACAALFVVLASMPGRSTPEMLPTAAFVLLRLLPMLVSPHTPVTAHAAGADLR